MSGSSGLESVNIADKLEALRSTVKSRKQSESVVRDDVTIWSSSARMFKEVKVRLTRDDSSITRQSSSRATDPSDAMRIISGRLKILNRFKISLIMTNWSPANLKNKSGIIFHGRE